MSYNPQNPNGQATSANSEPVVIASDQSAVPVTVAGGATAANQTTTNTSLASIDGKITAVNTGAVVVSSSALPALAATSTKQSDGSQKSQVVDGSGNVIGSTSNALDVNIKSGGGTDVVTGNIASGVADSGNPVKVGAKYNATKPTFADGQRGDLQIGTRGSLGTTIFAENGVSSVALSNQTADGVAGATIGLAASSFAYTYNGATFDRQRSDGTTGGLGVGGTVASGSADSGNPVKVGAKYNATKPTFTDGQRGDLQAGSRGALAVQLMIADSASPLNTGGTGDGTNAATLGLMTASENLVFNGTTWDRMRSGGVTGMVGVSGDTAAAAADAGNPVKVGGKYNATKPTYADGQRGDLQIGTRGALSVQLLSTDGTGSPVSGAPGDASSPGVSVITNSEMSVFNGTTWDRMRSGGVTGMAGVSGDTASGASDAGNPVKVGGLAKTALPTAVSDGQRVNALFTKNGKAVSVGSLREHLGRQNTTITSSTAETTIVTADVTYLLDIYGLVITNTSASNCEVQIRDATAGTVRYSFQVPAADTRGFMVPVDSSTPQTTVNNNWTATCISSVASIKITAMYVKNL